jgi:hypothetical protein
VAVIIVGVIVVLLACSCCGVSALMIARGVMEDRGAAPADTASAPIVTEDEEDAAPGDTVPTPVEPEPLEPEVEWVPEDTVIGLYVTAASGDRTSARSMWANPSDLETGVLESWGDPDWAIDDVTAGEANGEMLVQVWETGGGFSDGDTVTYVLREFDGAWLITGWALGTIEEYREWSRGQ